MTTKVRASHGLRQLLADDPCSFLLYAVEQVQEQAHHRRLGRVIKHLRRRKHELGWIHVTDADNSCDRTIAALLLGYQLPREPISPQLSRIFENGTYMHLRYYNYFLSLPPPFVPRIAEVVRRWPIVGEADVVVYHPEFDWQIVELKSMNSDQFKLLKKPKDDHELQLNGYLGLFEHLANGQVWYENKNTQDVKTFVWTPQEEQFQTTIQRVASIATTVLSGLLPHGCGVCGLDDYIGALEGIEERMGALGEVRNKYV